MIVVAGRGVRVKKAAFAVARALSLKYIEIDYDVVMHEVLGLKRRLVKTVKTFYPRLVDERCLRCGVCMLACQDRALIWTPHSGPRASPELCSSCKACMYACEPVAKAIVPDEVLAAKVYDAGEVTQVELVPSRAAAALKELRDQLEGVATVPPEKAHLLKGEIVRTPNPLLSEEELAREILRSLGYA